MARNSLIAYNKLRFLITDRPKDENLDDYIRILRQHNVRALVRVCEPSYDVTRIKEEGIEVFDWPYPDGASPPEDLINNWLKLHDRIFSGAKANDPSGPCIAVHCVAGLGRAPVMVALSLIKAGMSGQAAATFIRERRKGVINSKQLQFLFEQKRKKSGSVCTIS
eukprot:m.72172 g.72172  ORF g.72172 m.72172 type:complete len:165 (+) comp20224_c0_seq1:577-1071(+)